MVWDKEDEKKYNKQYYQKYKDILLERMKKYYWEKREVCLEYKKRWYREHPEEIKERVKQWRKKCPEKINEINRRYRRNHPEEIKKQGRQYYQRNKEIIKEYRKNYLKTDEGKMSNQRTYFKRRAIMENSVNTLTSQEWLCILEEYNYRCAYCDVEFDCENLPEKDHIIPISKGGDNTKENIVPACRSCNAKKHNNILIKR